MSTGLSRGNSQNKQFIENNANNYRVIAFVDVSANYPGDGTLDAAADGQQYVIDAGFSSINANWGTIASGEDKAIIRYRASKSQWEVIFAADASNHGATLYDKDTDTIFSFDSLDWNIASGSGGGVKNFAQKLATSYKVGDWTSGSSPVFGDSGTATAQMAVETANPLDGKKSYKIQTMATSENDWFYATVDIDLYARGGALAFVIDYSSNLPEDVKMKVFTADLSTELSTELNVLKNTENDNKKSRNARIIFAQADDQDQVVIGFQLPAGLAGGEELIFDNLKVTDDIGEIGSSGNSPVVKGYSKGRIGMGNLSYTTQLVSKTEEKLNGLGVPVTSNL